MDKNGNIFLVGLMGAGKTTLGKQFARQFGKTFLDADHELERRCGVNIPYIFEVEGEAGFRRREACLIRDLVQQRNLVLATGGGVVLDPENRRQLKEHGLVVYLKADPKILLERTRGDRNRPLLQTPDPLGRLQDLAVQRGPLYEEIADLVLDTGDANLGRLVAQLERALAQSSCE